MFFCLWISFIMIYCQVKRYINLVSVNQNRTNNFHIHSSPILWRNYIYHSLISREKKDVGKEKCLYMTGMKRSKIKARKATKDDLYRSFQIFLSYFNLHYKFNWVLFILDVTEDLIFFLSSIMNPRSHTFFMEYDFIYNKLNVIFNVKQHFFYETSFSLLINIILNMNWYEIDM